MNGGLWIAIISAFFSILAAAVAAWNRYTQMEILLEISKVRLEIAQIKVDASEWRVTDRHLLRGEMTEAILRTCQELDGKLDELKRDVDRRFRAVNEEMVRLIDRVHKKFDND